MTRGGARVGAKVGARVGARVGVIPPAEAGAEAEVPQRYGKGNSAVGEGYVPYHDSGTDICIQYHRKIVGQSVPYRLSPKK